MVSCFPNSDAGSSMDGTTDIFNLALRQPQNLRALHCSTWTLHMVFYIRFMLTLYFGRSSARDKALRSSDGCLIAK